MIEVRSATIMRSGRPVVVDATLDVGTGEVVALVGPNGSGKSTLVAAVGGDLAVAAGRITIDARDVSTLDPVAAARLRGVMTQSNPVSYGFTVREVVEFGRSPWRGTTQASGDDDAVNRAIDALDLKDLTNRGVQALSGGELARVAMARALAQEVNNLILDEPTAALDLRHQVDVLTIAREQARRGRTVLVVLHDLSLAAQFADRIAVMAGGAVVAVGAPEEVMQPAVISEVYGVPVVTLINPITGSPVILANARPAGV